MDIWEEIEKLDKRIIADKEKLRLLMKKRRDLHKGIGTEKKETPESKGIVEKIANAKSTVDKMNGNIVERTMKEKFVPPTQEEIASMRKDDDAKPT